MSRLEPNVLAFAAEECEKALAGACVVYGAAAVKVLNDLGFDPAQMFAPIPRLFVEFATAKAAKGENPSFPEFAAELAKHFPVAPISLVTDYCEHVGDGSRVGAWVNEIRNAARRRDADRRFRLVTENLAEGKDLEEVCESTANWIRDFQKPTQKKATHFADLLSSRLEDYSQPLDPTKTIKTGLDDLDELLALEGSDFFVVGGGTGSGKSMFGLNLVANILQSENCKGAGLIVSLEMPAHQIVDRLVARTAGISTVTLKRRTFHHADFGRLAATGKLASSLNLHIRDDCHELHAITAAARSLHAEHGLRVLMVDYLQLVKGPDKELREQQVAAVSRELRLLGLETGALVIGLIQLNKQGEARESSAIQMDATQFATIRTVNTEGRTYRGEDEEELDETRRRLEVGKQRDGSVGSVLLGFDGSRATFKNTEQIEKGFANGTPKRKFRGST